MSYRPDWWVDQAKGRSVLQIALDVHMTVTGACERSQDEQLDDLDLLKHVIKNWTPHRNQFDADVLALLTTAHAEGLERAVYPL